MKRLITWASAMFLAWVSAAEATVKGVTAQQRYPWNGKVDISYAVENAGAEDFGLVVWAEDLTTGVTNVAKNVTGDTAYANGEHHLVWDMSADGLTFVSSNVVFAVSYVKVPLYCAIDLSGGKSAKSYPLEYLTDVPAGGWSDEYKTTKLVLRKVEAGTFTMGSPTDELGRDDDERQHQVTLTKDYWIGVFEVTQRQWELVKGCRWGWFTNESCYATRPVDGVPYFWIRGESKGATWPSSSEVDEDSFLGVLRQKSGLMLDFPTEAQWEYACRAGTTSALNSGVNLTSLNQDDEMDKVGRYEYNSGPWRGQGVDTSGGTAKVGSYAPNAWGLYDMHGNVSEWCLDWYSSYPGDTTDPKGFSSGQYRIFRGGSYNWEARYCRSARRLYTDPSTWGTIGFRLVKSLSSHFASPSILRCGCIYGSYSGPIRIDLTVCERTAADTEVLTYSTNWAESMSAGAVAEVAVNGVVISSEAGMGMVEWTPTRNGTYLLTHRVMKGRTQIGEKLSTVFEVNRFPTRITNVVARQHYPWNGKVDISCTMENIGFEELAFTVWAIDQTTGITNVAKNVTGDTVYANGEHHLVWDMSADGLTFVSSNVIFCVSCEVKDPLYCSIDLSGGTNATSYQVLYLANVPAGGWSDKYKTTKLVLRKIKAGTFTMGTRSTDFPRSYDCLLHQVTLTKDCWMGVFEVTQRQWELVKGKRPSWFDNESCYASRPVEMVSYDMIRGSSVGAGWPSSSAVDEDSFLGVFRQKSGLMFDLPTEAQWEYACRAGTTTALNSGVNLTSLNQDDEMDKVGRYWYNGGSSYDQGVDTSGGTAKVGSYAPNAWGLYDMHGNVWERCLDWVGPYSGDATDPKGSTSGSYRISRGGSWDDSAGGCICSAESHGYPIGTSNNFGFRLIMTLSDDSSVPGKLQYGSVCDGCSDPIGIDLSVGAHAAEKAEMPVITAQTSFTGSQHRVSLVCGTKGAEIYYTTDGSDPTMQSVRYDRPFCVTDTTTVKAYATKADCANSYVATLVITKEWGIGDTLGKPDHAFETSGAKGFVRVEDATATLGESMRSGAIADAQQSILSTKVTGPGTLTFKWKASCEQDDEYEWDHGIFTVDGTPKGWINGLTDWIEVSERIEGEGEHTVTWTYVKDEVDSAEEDSIWVSDYAWTSDYARTQTTEVSVPYEWLKEKCPDVVDEYDDYEKVAKRTAGNPRFTVEQCYVAGLDPESTTNEFTSAVVMQDGIPIITWKPDLEGERTYKVWGKATLDKSENWQYPTNALHRFFKVTVEMPSVKR